MWFAFDDYFLSLSLFDLRTYKKNLNVISTLLKVPILLVTINFGIACPTSTNEIHKEKKKLQVEYVS